MARFLRLAFLISFFVQIFVVNSQETFADKLQSIDEKFEIFKNESQTQAKEMKEQFEILMDLIEFQQLQSKEILFELTQQRKEKEQEIEKLKAEQQILKNLNENLKQELLRSSNISAQLQIEKFLKKQAEQDEKLANVQLQSNEIPSKLTHQGKEKGQEIESLHEKLKNQQQILKNLNENLKQELLRSSNISAQLQICNQNSTQQTEIIQELKIEKLKLEDRFLQPCAFSLNQANTDRGIFKITLNESGLEPFDVSCQRLDEEAWLYIQRRQDGSENFNRNWNDYKNGFGDLDGEFWLGLEKLHQLTKDYEWELKIWLRDGKGNEGFARYKKFKIGNETEQYKLTVGEFCGNVTDEMVHHNGKPFSTPDRDNDEWPTGSCALRRKGGWWFRYYFYAHLNGDFHSSDETEHYGIYWWHFGKQLKYTQMAIRRLK